MGSLNVLNVGAGDITVTFNNMDDTEAKKAIRMLMDMRDRGYAILVLLEDGSYARAINIDAKRGRYILQLPADVADPPGAEMIDIPVPGKRGRGRPRKVGVPIERATATGVARSAGG